jgi:DNA-binding NtrC family response regulator
VDDNSLRLQALQARLELLGYEVLTANHGADALEIFTKRHVDLAVVDYYMHGMGGDIVALEMKRLRPDVPIIIFSGAFTLPEMVIALVDGFVFTGNGPENLIAKITQLLPQRRQIRKRKTGQDSAKGAA